MYGSRGSIGHVCPSIPLDMILNECDRMVPDDVMMVYSSLHVQQLRQEDFDRAISMLDEAVGFMVDGGADAIIVGGGPVVAVIGSDQGIVDRTKEISGKPSISTTGALITALDSLKAKKIAVATPYTDERNEILKTYLEARGFDVVGMGGLGITRAAEIARLPFNVPHDHAVAVAKSAPEAQAIYIPCARFPVVSTIGEIEAHAGLPVVTSTQAMIWWGMRTIGVTDDVSGFGQLYNVDPTPSRN
jgi:maleate cis-trans isomerase